MANNGKQGEQLFKEIMKYRGYGVDDVSNNPLYFKFDIDFLITSPTTGLTKTFEVKWDTRINKTRNLYLELTNINSRQWNGDGWWKHIRADYLVYGDAVTQQFYIIDIRDLRKRVSQLTPKIAYCGTDSTGLLVSLDDIADITTLLN